MEIFLHYLEDLKHLAKEIFTGYPNKSKHIKKTKKQKMREYFVIEIMFQMLVHVFRLYDIDYLPKNDIYGWRNTFVLIFASNTIREQWKHSRMLYGYSKGNDFIEKYGIIEKPRQNHS